MSAIDDLYRKVISLTYQLAAAKESLTNAKLEACELKLGMVVTYRGKEFRVTGIDVEHWNHAKPIVEWNKPWAVGNPRKADGSWGIADRNLYSHWEIVKAKKP